MLKRIDFSELEGVSVGNAQNDAAKKGVTVLVFPETATASVDIFGGGPASRETPVIGPEHADTPLNAIVFAGGSAYGLVASDGVMKCLEENKMGYDTIVALVPIVVQSDIFDLGYGNSTVRPDSAMGYEACKNALTSNNPVSGNTGAGTGASVGKLYGMKRAQKCGIGYSAFQLGDLKMGAVAVVNAFGDIYKGETKIAGLVDEERKNFVNLEEILFEMQEKNQLFVNSNTTISALVTNGNFTKTELKKIAVMARAAYSKCIRPCGTMGDGDTIYAASCGKKVKSDVNTAGMLATKAMEEAIWNAVESSKIPDEEYLKNINS